KNSSHDLRRTTASPWRRVVVLLFCYADSKACLGEANSKARTDHYLAPLQPCDKARTPPHPWSANHYCDKCRRSRAKTAVPVPMREDASAPLPEESVSV